VACGTVDVSVEIRVSSTEASCLMTMEILSMNHVTDKVTITDAVLARTWCYFGIIELAAFLFLPSVSSTHTRSVSYVVRVCPIVASFFYYHYHYYYIILQYIGP
jgi:hypothetical protein